VEGIPIIGITITSFSARIITSYYVIANLINLNVYSRIKNAHVYPFTSYALRVNNVGPSCCHFPIITSPVTTCLTFRSTRVTNWLRLFNHLYLPNFFSLTKLVNQGSYHPCFSLNLDTVDDPKRGMLKTTSLAKFSCLSHSFIKKRNNVPL